MICIRAASRTKNDPANPSAFTEIPLTHSADFGTSSIRQGATSRLYGAGWSSSPFTAWRANCACIVLWINWVRAEFMLYENGSNLRRSTHGSHRKRSEYGDWLDMMFPHCVANGARHCRRSAKDHSDSAHGGKP